MVISSFDRPIYLSIYLDYAKVSSVIVSLKSLCMSAMHVIDIIAMPFGTGVALMAPYSYIDAGCAVDRVD